MAERKKNREEMENLEKQTDGNVREDAGGLGIIGEEQIKEADETLRKYRDGKAKLDAKIADNEEFWKLNHWDVMQRNANGVSGSKEDDRIKPKSAWLFNTIMNKHADAMDNFPTVNILPRSRDDEQTAKSLSSIIPVIMEQNDYEKVYSDAEWYKQKNGGSVQGVFWNNDKENGLGNIDIRNIDILNLFWEPNISNIQDSPNLFYVQMVDKDEVKDRYPALENISGNEKLAVEYKNEESVDDSGMVAVVDWYYKRRVKFTDVNGITQVKTILHYCKYCEGKVIYASENDPNCNSGWYEHGMYPFVVDVLFPIAKSVCGLGYIDLHKDNQLYIDKLDQGIMENSVTNSRPRWLVKTSAGVNEGELLDISRPVVHADGDISENAVRNLSGNPLSPIYENVRIQKIQEMKDTSGNTASSQGQASSVTSASGIASLQEAAGKLSRDSNSESYRAYKQVVYLVIELIRQFYTETRTFRITGESGQNEYIEFNNEGLDIRDRKPIMDIVAKPQKRNAYSRESQNQTALNLYGMGFFAPANADAALACLEMMDFDGIEKMRNRISQNGTLMQMVIQLQQQLNMYASALVQAGVVLDSQNGTNIVEQISGRQQANQAQIAQQIQSGSGTRTTTTNNLRGSLSSQAASASRKSTSPR